MAGQPKNKVTRAEQGKRRRGNTPKLLKNLPQAKTPLHKQTLFARFLGKVKKQKVDDAKKNAKSATSQQQGQQLTQQPMTARSPMAVKPQTRNTQHKGG